MPKYTRNKSKNGENKDQGPSTPKLGSGPGPAARDTPATSPPHSPPTLSPIVTEPDILEDRYMAQAQELAYVKTQLAQQVTLNKQLLAKIDNLENTQRIKNLKIDGKAENENENLRQYIGSIATAVGTECAPNEISEVYRLGKKYENAKRPRTIMVKFTSESKRNDLYYNKAKLRGNKDYERIWLNDDVCENTRRQRENMRSVSKLAKRLDIEHKLHSDGIIIGGNKIKLDETDRLPDIISLDKAKTIEVRGEIFFHSEHSPLSNMYETPVDFIGSTYTSAEHAYQATKAKVAGDLKLAEAIQRTPCPYEAQTLGKRTKTSAAWDREKDLVMKRVLEAKFKTTKLNKVLTDTGNRVLHEATRQSYWGINATLHSQQVHGGTWNGKDRLGSLLIELRTELKAKAERSQEQE